MIVWNGEDEGTHKAKGKWFEPLFTQVYIFCQKVYLGSRGACGGGWLAGIFFTLGSRGDYGGG